MLGRAVLLGLILLGCAAGQAPMSTSSVASINNLKNAAYCADTSVSANTITCSTAVGFTGYAAGQSVDVLLANSITAATTININSLGAKAVTYNGTNALTSALGLVAGATMRVQYDGTRFVMQGLVNTATPVAPGSPNLSLQYNNGGAFGGTSLEWNAGLISVNGTMFFGNGLNDATYSGTYTGAPAVNQNAITTFITTLGTPDKFKWQQCNPSCGAASAEIAITGAPQLLTSGISITFGSTTGHGNGDSWDIQLGTLVFTNLQFAEIPNAGTPRVDSNGFILCCETLLPANAAGALTNDGTGVKTWQPSGQTPCVFSTLGTVLTAGGQSCACADCTVTSGADNTCADDTSGAAPPTVHATVTVINGVNKCFI